MRYTHVNTSTQHTEHLPPYDHWDHLNNDLNSGLNSDYNSELSQGLNNSDDIFRNREIMNGKNSHFNGKKEAIYRNGLNVGDNHHVATNSVGKKLHRYKLKSEVPEFLWEPGILTGYRETNQPWSYYLWSLFSIHCDTGNIWTSLLLPLLYVATVYFLSAPVDFTQDASAHAILVFLTTSSMCALLSAIAHLLHARSEVTHYLVFALDHVGIALYGYGGGVIVYYCAGNNIFYDTFGAIFIPGLMGTTFLCTFLNMFSRVYYGNRKCLGRKVMQVGGCFIGLLWSHTVFLSRVYGYFLKDEQQQGFLLRALVTISFLALNAVLFSLHQPERWFPGKFDIWGHGHQFFHLSVACCSISQIYNGFTDLLLTPRDILDRAQPDIMRVWINLLTVIVVNFMILALFYPYLKRSAQNAKLTHKKSS